MFPISRDPPEGGTRQPGRSLPGSGTLLRFQFLGIPPKGELLYKAVAQVQALTSFQFLGIPPKGELSHLVVVNPVCIVFPISRDPPEGGTIQQNVGGRSKDYQVSNF